MKTKTQKPIKISEMRNLGPAVEKDLKAMGITTAAQVHRLGAEKSFIAMLKGRQKINRSAKCCNALYLYAFYAAIENIDWRKIPAAKKKEFKIYTEKLRASGKFK